MNYENKWHFNIKFSPNPTTKWIRFNPNGHTILETFMVTFYKRSRNIPMSNVRKTFQKRSKNVFRTLNIGMFLERL